MIKRALTLLILAAALLSLCTACAPGGAFAGAAARASGTPLPTAVPTPEPTLAPPPEAEAVEEAFAEILLSTPLSLDPAAACAAMELPEQPAFTDILAHADAWKEVAAQWYLALCDACSEAAAQLEERFEDAALEFSIEVGTMDWKYAGSLFWALPEDFWAWDLFDVACAAELLPDGGVLLTAAVEPAAFQPFLQELAGDDRELYLAVRFLMSYLTTVYDADGEETDYVMPDVPEAYLDAMGKPLEWTRFYDRWYQGRSRNTRKHTGLDMHSPANAEIYSCTDGTVLYIGYDDVAGYYVIVLDDAGYEYHYYHMIRETDFLEEGQRVKTGELIGHVGNTGNSAVNHLHLGLITPDSEYVRLYDVMYEKYFS